MKLNICVPAVGVTILVTAYIMTLFSFIPWMVDRDYKSNTPCSVTTNCDTYAHYLRYQGRIASDLVSHLW